MTETVLDTAFARMATREADEDARRQFYALLAASEVLILLEAPPDGDRLRPMILETGDGKLALAFDQAERLAAFLPEGGHYATVTGLDLARMLAGAGIGLGLNLDVAPSSTVVPVAVLAWLVEAGGTQAVAGDQTLAAIRPPQAVAEGLLDAITQAARRAAPFAETACLVEAASEEAGDRLVLLLPDVPLPVQKAVSGRLSQSLGGAMSADRRLDVVFVEISDPVWQRAETVGILIRLAEGPASPGAPSAPGSNPEKPPRLI